LEKAFARRKAAQRQGLVAAIQKRGAWKTPLEPSFQRAMRAAGLSAPLIARCIDGWPDAQKEVARQAVVQAVRSGRTVRVRWGLTDGVACKIDVSPGNTGPVTITALSPRSSLRVRAGRIEVKP
jgi:hypothetical protein